MIYDYPSITTISAPLLEQVGIYLTVGYYEWEGAEGVFKLETLDLSQLRIVGDEDSPGYFEINKPGPLKSLELPMLETVTRGFDLMDCHNLATVSAPKFKHVGSLRIGPSRFHTTGAELSLTSLDLSSLQTVERSLVIDRAGPIVSLELPMLESVGPNQYGRFQLTDCHNLATVSAPKFKHVGWLRISAVPGLVSLDLSSLQTVEHSLVIDRAGPIASIELNELRTAGNNTLYDKNRPFSEGVRITNCPGLTSLSFDKLASVRAHFSARCR